MTTRVCNFSAGPAAMPEPVLQRAQAELLDWHGSGMSVMEMSHRGSRVHVDHRARPKRDLRDAARRFRRTTSVLFLQGGAIAQFAAVPAEPAAAGRASPTTSTPATGRQKAIAEAQQVRRRQRRGVERRCRNFTYVPPQSAWKLSTDARVRARLRPTRRSAASNIHWIPDTGSVPLVADTSSHILSRPLDVSKFGLIYAGAQKNIGPAGLTIVIVRDDLTRSRAPRHARACSTTRCRPKADSMFNTPPTFAIYLAGLTFKWLLSAGRPRGNRARQRREGAGAAMRRSTAPDFYRNPGATGGPLAR